MKLTVDEATGDLLKVQQAFRISLDKITKATARAFHNQNKKALSTWEKTLYTLLSKRVPTGIEKGKKQRPDDNPTPHYNRTSGSSPHLKDTVETSSSLRYTEAGNASMSLRASVGMSGGEELRSAAYTNQGKPGRKDGSVASWAGWHDNVMRPFFEGYREFNIADEISSDMGANNLGSFRVKSVLDIMDEILANRANLPQIPKS